MKLCQPQEQELAGSLSCKNEQQLSRIVFARGELLLIRKCTYRIEDKEKNRYASHATPGAHALSGCLGKVRRPSRYSCFWWRGGSSGSCSGSLMQVLPTDRIYSKSCAVFQDII